jgi:hypothetical protein
MTGGYSRPFFIHRTPAKNTQDDRASLVPRIATLIVKLHHEI